MANRTKTQASKTIRKKAPGPNSANSTRRKGVAIHSGSKKAGNARFTENDEIQSETPVETLPETLGLTLAQTLGNPPKPLSLKEKGVLEFLESYMCEKGISPTYQEICQHFGFASFNSVQRYLKQLEVKGYIQLPWSNQKRAITILKPSSAFQSAMEEIQSETSAGNGGSGSHLSFANFKSNGRTTSTSSVSTMLPAVFPTESMSIPLLGRVAAGAPIEAFEHDEFIDVPASLVRYADRTYALRVQGQSMIDDGILDGDVILVQRQTSATNGEIVVAVIEDEATVKRFYMHRGDAAAQGTTHPKSDDSEARGKMPGKMIELRPANSTMSPMWFEPEQVQIRGVVVGLIRRFF